MASLVLASAASHRATLLSRLGVEFEARAAAIDERALERALGSVSTSELAVALAEAKARDVERSLDTGPTWVLGADQITALAQQRLHKPTSLDGAVERLMQLRGRTHRLVNGLALVRGDERLVAVDERRVTMRDYSEAQARRYVETARPLGSAAAYHIEDAGISLIASVEGGDDSGVIGLPLVALGDLLAQAGLLAHR